MFRCTTEGPCDPKLTLPGDLSLTQWGANKRPLWCRGGRRDFLNLKPRRGDGVLYLGQSLDSSGYIILDLCHLGTEHQPLAVGGNGHGSQAPSSVLTWHAARPRKMGAPSFPPVPGEWKEQEKSRSGWPAQAPLQPHAPTLPHDCCTTSIIQVPVSTQAGPEAAWICSFPVPQPRPLLGHSRSGGEGWAVVGKGEKQMDPHFPSTLVASSMEQN